MKTYDVKGEPLTPIWDVLSHSAAVQKMVDVGTTLEKISEDLYTLLTDKSEGEAALRVKSHEPGSGILAF